MITQVAVNHLVAQGWRVISVTSPSDGGHHGFQTAITKTGDEKRVLEAYVKSNGRRRVLEMIFGASPSKLEEKFINSATSLLFYWRDETERGTISIVSEIEAFHSLTMLVRLAQFLFQMGEPSPKAVAP